MKIDLLLPLQTCPSATHLGAHPEAGGHMVSFGFNIGKCLFTEVPLTYQRTVSLVVYFLLMIFQIEVVPKILVTRLTSELAWGFGLWRGGTPLASSCLDSQSNFWQHRDQQVTLMSWKLHHMIALLQVDNLNIFRVSAEHLIEGRRRARGSTHWDAGGRGG